MWRKGNRHALVGGCRLVQPLWKSTMLPQKIRNRTALWTSNSTSGDLSKETQNTNSKEYMHPYSTAALFTGAKTWEQPKCPSTDKWIKKVEVLTSIHNGIQLSHNKEWNLICGVFGQDRGIGRCCSPLCTTTSKLHLKYRTTITQNCQKSSWVEVWQLRSWRNYIHPDWQEGCRWGSRSLTYVW